MKRERNWRAVSIAHGVFRVRVHCLTKLLRSGFFVGVNNDSHIITIEHCLDVLEPQLAIEVLVEEVSRSIHNGLEVIGRGIGNRVVVRGDVNIRALHVRAIAEPGTAGYSRTHRERVWEFRIVGESLRGLVTH